MSFWPEIGKLAIFSTIFVSMKKPEIVRAGLNISFFQLLCFLARKVSSHRLRASDPPAPLLPRTQSGFAPHARK